MAVPAISKRRITRIETTPQRDGSKNRRVERDNHDDDDTTTTTTTTDVSKSLGTNDDDMNPYHEENFATQDESKW